MGNPEKQSGISRRAFLFGSAAAAADAAWELSGRTGVVRGIASLLGSGEDRASNTQERIDPPHPGITTTSATEPVTTTIPEVLRSDRGRALREFGYTDSEAEQIIGNIKHYHKIETTHATEVISFLDARYSPQGAQIAQKYVEEVAQSGAIHTANPYGTGEVTYQIIPQKSKENKIAIFAPLEMPHPMSRYELNGLKSSYGSTLYGYSMIKIDQSTQFAARSANILYIAEGLWREASFNILSQDPNVDPKNLHLAVGEVTVNWLGRIAGLKMSGNPPDEIARSVASEVNLHTFNVPLKLPAFDLAVYDQAPGIEGRIFS
jgi:hypothetical protein